MLQGAETEFDANEKMLSAETFTQRLNKKFGKNVPYTYKVGEVSSTLLRLIR